MHKMVLILQDPVDGRPKASFLSFDSHINLPFKIIYVIIAPDLC